MWRQVVVLLQDLQPVQHLLHLHLALHLLLVLGLLRPLDLSLLHLDSLGHVPRASVLGVSPGPDPGWQFQGILGSVGRVPPGLLAAPFLAIDLILAEIVVVGHVLAVAEGVLAVVGVLGEGFDFLVAGGGEEVLFLPRALPLLLGPFLVIEAELASLLDEVPGHLGVGLAELLLLLVVAKVQQPVLEF